MKKILLLLLFVVPGITYAQTYYYEFYAAEDPNTGARSRYSGSFYLTFESGKTRFYQASADGKQMAGYGRMDEFGQDTSYDKVIQVVMGYGPFGPIMGTAVVNSESDGIFVFNGYSNGWREYRAYKYQYYYALNKTQYGNGWYIYAYVSDDYSVIRVKDASKYANSGKVLFARRSESPSNRSAPSQMW
ncbi:MAG: hypothetical protein J5871_02510 [Bacteroidales bacterium]|nr:hypothetical protein [Bacteroidales bacterium]